MSPHIIGPLSYIVAFILILFGFSILGRMMKGFVNAIHAGFLNDLAGAAFSAFKWMLLFSLFLNVVETLDSREWIIKAETKQKSFSHNFVKSLMPAIVPYLSSHNNDNTIPSQKQSPAQTVKDHNPYTQKKKHATI